MKLSIQEVFDAAQERMEDRADYAKQYPEEYDPGVPEDIEAEAEAFRALPIHPTAYQLLDLMLGAKDSAPAGVNAFATRVEEPNGFTRITLNVNGRDWVSFDHDGHVHIYEPGDLAGDKEA